MGAKGENLKEGVEMAKRYCNASAPKSWSMPAEGFKGHVAADGSLLGNAGKWVSMWLVSGAIGL